MTEILKFTPQAMRDIRAKAEKSLYFHSRGLMRSVDMTPELHLPICNFLQHPTNNPNRWGLCIARGSLKSEMLIDYLWWKGLNVIDWSSLLVMQKYDLSKAHLQRMQRKLTVGPLANFLQDLYQDRLESRDEGNLLKKWTTERIVLVRHEPHAEPFCTIGSLDGRLESVHRSGIFGDDLEGSDADKSDAPNEASSDFVYQRAEPLLIHPSTDEIGITGTPHGKKPLMHALKRDPQFRMFWGPVLNESGESIWPERYTKEWIAAKQAAAQVSSKARRMWDMQYMLRESSVGSGLFDIERIRANCYSISGGRLIRYMAMTKNDQGEQVATPKYVDLGSCRFFIHGDPGHKSPEERIDHSDTPSLWAWIVTAVSPDFHVFVVETWMKECGLDEYVDAFFSLYRKWSPYQWTFEGVGAQSWLPNVLRLHERTDKRRLTSRTRPWQTSRRLPAPSSRLEPSPRQGIDKETHILEQLEVWHNAGWLHIHESMEELLHQHEIFPSNQHAIDGLDALSQGPLVWDPPLSEESRTAKLRREAHMRLMSSVEPLTGYSQPWSTQTPP